jgi:sugar phosphate isomerase/epimerase
MGMDIAIERDLWSYLQTAEKTVVLYGMGNGADKILAACAQKNVAVSEFFASDGFVRGQVFHGRTVLSWSEVKARYGAENVIVLLSFGTSRKDVLENIERIAAEAELYIPDVPVFGDGLFDAAYAKEHWGELEATAELFSCAADIIPHDVPVLFENLWWPGLTLTDRRETEAFFRLIDRDSAGIMLDTGHLMNTNTALRSEEEAADYILRTVDRLGDLASRIRGMHLQCSLSGDYVTHSLRRRT